MSNDSLDELDDRTNAPAPAGGLETLRVQGEKGAHWFYWVAALSLVNSVIVLAEGNLRFVVGLGVTLLADVFAAEIGKQTPEMATVIKGVAFAFNLFVAAVAAGFGWLAAKRYLWIFGIGMFLYLLDGLLFFLFQDWLSVAFHAYALFGMFVGFRAFRQLSALEARVASEETVGEERAPGREAAF